MEPPDTDATETTSPFTPESTSASMAPNPQVAARCPPPETATPMRRAFFPPEPSSIMRGSDREPRPEPRDDSPFAWWRWGVRAPACTAEGNVRPADPPGQGPRRGNVLRPAPGRLEGYSEI